MNSTLLTISVIAVLLPGAFVMALETTSDSNTINNEVLHMSHGVRSPTSGINEYI